MVEHPKDAIPPDPAREDAAFVYGSSASSPAPSSAPSSAVPDPDPPPVAALWHALMARWIGHPEPEKPAEPPADIWW